MLSALLIKCETRARELLSTGSAEDSAGIARFQAELLQDLLSLIAGQLPDFEILPENQSTLTKIIAALSASALSQDPNLLNLQAYAFFFEALQKSPAILAIYRAKDSDDAQLLELINRYSLNPRSALLFFHADKTRGYPTWVIQAFQQLQIRLIRLNREQGSAAEQAARPIEQRESPHSSHFEPRADVMEALILKPASPLNIVELLGVTADSKADAHGQSRGGAKQTKSNSDPKDKYVARNSVIDTVLRDTSYTPFAQAVLAGNTSKIKNLCISSGSESLEEKVHYRRYGMFGYEHSVLLLANNLETLLFVLRLKLLSCADSSDFFRFLKCLALQKGPDGLILLRNILGYSRWSYQDRIDLAKLLAPFAPVEFLNPSFFQDIFSQYTSPDFLESLHLLISSVLQRGRDGVETDTTLANVDSGYGQLSLAQTQSNPFIAALLVSNPGLAKLAIFLFKDLFVRPRANQPTLLEQYLDAFVYEYIRKPNQVLDSLCNSSAFLAGIMPPERVSSLLYNALRAILYNVSSLFKRPGFIIHDHHFYVGQISEFLNSRSFGFTLSSNDQDRLRRHITFVRGHIVLLKYFQLYYGSELESEDMQHSIHVRQQCARHTLLAMVGQGLERYLEFISKPSDIPDSSGLVKSGSFPHDDILQTLFLQTALCEITDQCCIDNTPFLVCHVWAEMQLLLLRDLSEPRYDAWRANPKIDLRFVFSLLEKGSLTGHVVEDRNSSAYLLLKLVMYQRACPEAFMLIDLIQMKISDATLTAAGFSSEQIKIVPQYIESWAKLFLQPSSGLALTEGNVLPITFEQFQQLLARERQSFPKLSEKFDAFAEELLPYKTSGISFSTLSYLLNEWNGIFADLASTKSTKQSFFPQPSYPIIPSAILGSVRMAIEDVAFSKKIPAASSLLAIQQDFVGALKQEPANAMTLLQNPECRRQLLADPRCMDIISACIDVVPGFAVKLCQKQADDGFAYFFQTIDDLVALAGKSRLFFQCLQAELMLIGVANVFWLPLISTQEALDKLLVVMPDLDPEVLDSLSESFSAQCRPK